MNPRANRSPLALPGSRAASVSQLIDTPLLEGMLTVDHSKQANDVFSPERSTA